MTTVPLALIFDLDDTLVEEEPARDAALLATARLAASAGADPERVREAVRRRARELWWDHPLHAFAHGIGVSSWEALWARFEGDHPSLAALRAWAPTYRELAWRRALEDEGVADRALAGSLAERFRVERRGRQRAFPDAVPTLEALRADGRFRLAVLTNGLSCLQREKLAGAGLEGYFDVVVAGGDVGSRKPRTDVYEHVLDRLRTGRDRALMIGNNPETDIAGAVEAGIEAILVRRPGVPARAVPAGLLTVRVAPDVRTCARWLGVPVGAGSERRRLSGRGRRADPRSSRA